MATSLIALLLSLASFVFALLVLADSRRSRRDHHRAAALSATHTATLLLDEAESIVRRVDALLALPGFDFDEATARRYAEYRRTIAADRARMAKDMTSVAFADLAVVESREIAARSTLAVHRAIAERREILDALYGLREQVARRAAVPGRGLHAGDGGASSVQRA